MICGAATEPEAGTEIGRERTKAIAFKMACFSLDLEVGHLRDEALREFPKMALVSKWQLAARRFQNGLGECERCLTLGVKMLRAAVPSLSSQLEDLSACDWGYTSTGNRHLIMSEILAKRHTLNRRGGPKWQNMCSAIGADASFRIVVTVRRDSWPEPPSRKRPSHPTLERVFHAAAEGRDISPR